MRDDVQRRKLNLTQLRKNKRNRPDKTSGRKRPRTADVDIIAAPDADPSVTSAATGHVDDNVEPDDDLDDAVFATHATVLILLLAKTERSTR